jgi:hypothetical protein
MIEHRHKPIIWKPLAGLPHIKTVMGNSLLTRVDVNSDVPAIDLA